MTLTVMAVMALFGANCVTAGATPASPVTVPAEALPAQPAPAEAPPAKPPKPLND